MALVLLDVENMSHEFNKPFVSIPDSHSKINFMARNFVGFGVLGIGGVLLSLPFALGWGGVGWLLFPFPLPPPGTSRPGGGRTFKALALGGAPNITALGK